MITPLKNKPVLTDEDKEAEIQRLREQVNTLKKNAGIDDLAIETERIRQENEERLKAAKEEEEKKRAADVEMKKLEREKHIQQVFTDQFNKKIRIFRIHSDKTGRKAEFYTKLPISCPHCGSDDIPVLNELKVQAVEIFDEFQQDPVKMLERPYMSIYSRELYCSKCKQNFPCHIQIAL